jgi:methylglyoxal synthase
MPLTLALVAHDQKKAALAAWVQRHHAVLAGHRLISTATTGARIRQVAPDLHIEMVKSGPMGGDQQIGAMIAEGRISALVFFADPLTAMPHDVDIKALLRLVLVYDVPCAMSAATADLIAASGLFGSLTKSPRSVEQA